MSERPPVAAVTRAAPEGPSLACPSGYALTPAKRAPMPDALGEAWGERVGLHCAGPGGASSEWPPEVGDAFFTFEESTWVSQTPPLYVIAWGFFGYAGGTARALMRACVARPVVRNLLAWRKGPGGLWTIHAEDVPGLCIAGVRAWRASPRPRPSPSCAALMRAWDLSHMEGRRLRERPPERAKIGRAHV